VDGVLAKYIAFDEQAVAKIPNNLSDVDVVQGRFASRLSAQSLLVI